MVCLASYSFSPTSDIVVVGGGGGGECVVRSRGVGSTNQKTHKTDSRCLCCCYVFFFV